MSYEFIEEARQHFDTITLPWLEKNGKRIGKESSQGNVEAKKIVDVYKLLHARFEQATYGILCAMIENYKRVNDEELNKNLKKDI